jgi:hypothetical protein
MLKTHFMYSHIQSFQEKQSVHTHRKKKPPKPISSRLENLQRKKEEKKPDAKHRLWFMEHKETKHKRCKSQKPAKGRDQRAKRRRASNNTRCAGRLLQARAEQSTNSPPPRQSSPLHSAYKQQGGCWLTPLLPRPPPPLPHKRQQLPTIPFPSPPFFLRPPLFVPPNPPSPFEIAPKPPGPGGDSPPRRLPPRRHQSPRLARVDPSHSFDPASRGRLRFFPGRRRPDSGSAGRSALIRRREVLLVSPTSKPRFLLGLSGGSLGAAVRRRRRRVVGGMGLLRRGISSTRRGAAA